MKNTKILIISAALAAGLCQSASLLAHTGLSASVPADTAVISSAPGTLDLRFTEAVRLLRLDLHDSEGREVETAFSPMAQQMPEFTVPMPALNPGAYTVNWTIMGADSHRVEGVISFTIDPAAAPEAQASMEDHSGP